VPDSGGRTIRRRQLGNELRRLRQYAGLTGAQVAVNLRWSVSKVSRIETGHSRVREEELQALLDLYQVSEERRPELSILARDSSKTAWVDEAAIASYPAGYAAYIYAEAEAATIWDWEPQVVPGLLQTERYAREVMRGWYEMFRLSPSDLERRVRARIKRQQVLSRDQPPDFLVVIDESVIRRRYGDNSIMREQIEWLYRSIDLPNVDVRVLPLDGDHPIGTGAFTYMQFADVDNVKLLPDMAATEQIDGTNLLEDATETNTYRVTFESLRDSALDAGQSRDLIVHTIRLLWT
jgi:transcriptional regulator with XRE-family HTH domain